MCTSYFPELNPAIAKDLALAMRIYVCENQDLIMPPKYPTDTSNGVVLALTGAGYVFETVFKRSNVCSANSWCSPYCRPPDHVNIVKSKELTLLRDDTLKASTYNMPALHEINTEPIMENGLSPAACGEYTRTMMLIRVILLRKSFDATWISM